MSKLIVSILSLFFFFSAFAQEDINQLNAQGERVGMWKKYHANKRIRYQGQFENGKEVGVFKFYSIVSSDNPILIKTFSSRDREAQVKFFSEKGVLESEGKMIGKERIGKWVYYKKGKQIVAEELYENGKLSGEYKIFYPNGKLTELSHFKDGKLHGNSKRYSDAGVLLDDLMYVNGEIHGEAVYYDGSGKVRQKGLYESDLKVGVWEFYTDGQLSKSMEVKSVPIKGD
jgi:antitoxin component YwqK of YwqJK toxin-antitoxin module